MTRYDIISCIGRLYLTSNIENDEYSFVKAADRKKGKEKLEAAVGAEINHFKADIRFSGVSKDGSKITVLVETKQDFSADEENAVKQLDAYVRNERAIHRTARIIAILANTSNDKVKAWKIAPPDQAQDKSESFCTSDSFLASETILQPMSHYMELFELKLENDKERVVRNTYKLNKLLHKMGIGEDKRSQLVGTCLLFLKQQLAAKSSAKHISSHTLETLRACWEAYPNPQTFIGAIEGILEDLLQEPSNEHKDPNKKTKIDLLEKNVLDDQNIRKLAKDHWIELLGTILMDIYRYIDADSSEGQDILNLFFVAFNKYVGTDKNQVFTPDHITDFMCKVVGVNKNTKVFDGTCGSGSFLVQALCQAIADCKDEAERETVKKEHIFGVESEEKAYGLATTNMLIHGDGNSNIQFGSIFNEEMFIVKALSGNGEKVILMNPPYNAIPKDIPEAYKADWGDAVDGLEDPTKGLVFVQYISDVLKRNNISNVKLCVLLPVAVAIGGGKGKVMKVVKRKILEDNTLEAVFSLPDDIFYPSVSVNACCMLFTMNKSHYAESKDGTRKPRSKTFFGYFKEDGFRKVKNIGRMDVGSGWKALRDQWLELFRGQYVEAGLSAKKEVTGDDEWLCEAYMETDYDKLSELDFAQTVRDYVSYLIKSPSTNRGICDASC